MFFIPIILYQDFMADCWGDMLKKCYAVTTIHANIRLLNFCQKLLRCVTLRFADCIACNSKNTKNSFFMVTKFVYLTLKIIFL